ncbi:MAG: 30S ribosomal protein S7, partial [Aeriscardovia sp.]|nr:30S ribosomal protein S7 [Aeriscardovia sp.]
MSRKGPAKKRTIEPDPIYKSTTVAQLINKVLKDGKKSVAETIVYTALEKVGKKSDQEALGV